MNLDVATERWVGPIDPAVFDLIAPATPDWFTLYAIEGPEAFRHIWVDPRADESAGRRTGALVGRMVSDVYTAEVAARFYDSARQAMATHRPIRFDAVPIGVSMAPSIERTMSALFGADGQATQLLVVTRDLSDASGPKLAMGSDEQLLRKLLAHSNDIISLVDEFGDITFAAASFETVLGYSSDDLLGQSAFSLIAPQDEPAVRSFFADVLDQPRTPMCIEARVRRRDGKVLYAECTLTNLLDDPDIGAIVVNARDLSDRNDEIDQLAHRALHDELTGLPNRTLMTDQLDVMLTRASSPDRLAAAYYVQLDGCRMIGDTLGSQIGDRLTREAAQRLVDEVGPNGWVGRVGSEDFVITATSLGSNEQHLPLAQQIQARLAQPFLIDDAELYLTPRVGLALASADTGTTAEQLLRNADIAKHDAKVSTPNHPRVYDNALREQAERRLETMGMLRSAIEGDEFELYYQPVFNLSTGAAVGIEGLLRWLQPTKGLIPPIDFISLAEETGLIVPIGNWVMRNAFEHAAHWARRGFTSLQTAINVSPRQLGDPQFVARLRGEIERSGISAANVMLEITETTIMENPDGAQCVLAQVSELGAKIAIDHFGCGYSSLGYLSRFPATHLKIDRQFVSQLTTDAMSRPASKPVSPNALVRAIIDMAHGLGLEVIAEGVETEEQASVLRTLGCENAQGFWLGRPVPTSELAPVLDGSRPRNHPGAIAAQGRA